MSISQQEWPWQYNFPPFFTLQPHPETRFKQVAAWKALIMNYCKRSKTFILEVNEAASMTLFNNAAISRKLDTGVIISIMCELQKSGNATPIDKAKYRWEIYWMSPEEWASKVYNYVTTNGLYKLCCYSDLLCCSHVGTYIHDACMYVYVNLSVSHVLYIACVIEYLYTKIFVKLQNNTACDWFGMSILF